MRQEELQPDAITYTTLLSACGMGGKPECAVQHFDEMRQVELLPDVITCNVLFSAYGKGSMPKWAWQQLR